MLIFIEVCRDSAKFEFDSALLSLLQTLISIEVCRDSAKQYLKNIVQ